MLLSTPQTPFPNTQSNHTNSPFLPPNYTKPHLSCRATTNTSAQRPLSITGSSSTSQTCLRYVSGGYEEEIQDEDSLVSSAAAVAAAISNASTSPVEFVQRIEKSGGIKNKALVLPSQDFQKLCVEQLDLFRRIVDPHAVLSVYVRPAGSYVMDRLELRRITYYPGVQATDIVVLVGTFTVLAGLRVAEAAISSQQAECFAEHGAVVFPLVTHPFVVGFLVAEIPRRVLEREWHEIKEHPFSGKPFALPPIKDPQPLDFKASMNYSADMPKFNTEQKQNAVNITRSLAMAYVMDQKAILLQQSSWQNNVRMSNLVEQIRGSLSSIQTLSKMLSVHLKKSEIPYDIIENILVQGDRMKDTLQQLQDAVYFTKANIMRYNNETLKKIHSPSGSQAGLKGPQLSSSLPLETTTSEMEGSNGRLSATSTLNDLELPMPPLALAPSQQGIRRPSTVSDILEDLVEAIKPLAHMQRRSVELCDLSGSLQVAVEEPALRQALSNLIEGALLRTEIEGKTEIVSTGAPAGGALIIIDDDGPDMQYMTQMHSLLPFGGAENKIEDDMTWNFIAGLSVAREILESYGCVVRVVSPKNPDAPLGAGGTRVELWLPSYSDTVTNDLNQEA